MAVGQRMNFFILNWLDEMDKKRPPEVERGYVCPPPVDIEQLVREAEQARELMKEMQC